MISAACTSALSGIVYYVICLKPIYHVVVDCRESSINSITTIVTVRLDGNGIQGKESVTSLSNAQYMSNVKYVRKNVSGYH